MQPCCNDSRGEEPGAPVLSVVVPVFNEAGNIGPLAGQIGEALDSWDSNYEIVFVDDGSTDGSWAEIRRAHALNPKVRGLRHLENGGQSAALWTGFQATHSPLLATLDGDLQNDPMDLPKMVRELSGVDFISGQRINRQDNWIRRTSSRLARWARRAVLKVDVCDTGCAVRVFRRNCLEGIFPFAGFHRFLPVLVHANGRKTLEVPVAHRRRAAGVSKYGIGNRLFCGLYDLFAIAWYQRRRITPVRFVSLEEREIDAANAVELSSPWPPATLPSLASS